MNIYERFTENEINGEIENWISGGIDSGLRLGFPTFIGEQNSCGLDDLYRVKMGSTTYIFGIPAHGKTTLSNEILIDLAEFHGIKHAVLSPESGLIKDHKRDLLEMWIKQSFYTVEKDRQLEAYTKAKAAAQIMDNHFYFMKPKTKRLHDVLECAREMVIELGVNVVTIDPWNEFEHEMGTLREDQYLAKTLGEIREFAAIHNIHFFVVAHPKTLQRGKDGAFMPPSFYDMSGGAMWSNKAMSVICPFRQNMVDDDASVDIMVLKSKPRYTGRKGTAKMFYDLNTLRYYRLNGGEKIYARNPKLYTSAPLAAGGAEYNPDQWTDGGGSGFF